MNARAIEKTEREIEGVSASVGALDAEIRVALKERPQEVRALRKKEEQVRKKEEQLRKKEEQLRKKEKMLMEREQGEKQQGTQGELLRTMEAQLRTMEEQLRDKDKRLMELMERERGGHPAEQPILDLLSAIRAYDPPNDGNDRHVVLPEGVIWPTMASKVLFVRHFYADLYENVLGGLAQGEKTGRFNKFIICGNPGIGKSAFGLYCLFRALKDNRTVVYQVEKLVSCYVFSGESCREVPLVSLTSQVVKPPELSDPRTVFITDSTTPPMVQAFTVFITSPRRSRWHEYSKGVDVSMLYLPVFTESEIQECRAVCFPELDEGDVMQRYAKWGGIPRYVLTKLKLDDQRQLDDAVGSADYNAMRKAVAGLIDTDTDKLSSRLLHIKVVGESELNDEQVELVSPDMEAYYQRAGVELASYYVTQMLVERSSKESANQLENFVAESVGNESYAGTAGKLFEIVAMRKIAAGGSFQRRRVDNGVLDRIEFPAVPQVYFTTGGLGRCFDENGVGAWYSPVSSRYPAVDAVLACVETGSSARFPAPANATISETHAVILRAVKSEEGLASVVEALKFGAKDDIPFLWLVPSKIFTSFTPGSFYDEGRKIKDDDVKGHSLAHRVVHYTVNIPLSPKEKAADGLGRD